MIHIIREKIDHNYLAVVKNDLNHADNSIQNNCKLTRRGRLPFCLFLGSK